MTTAPVPDYMEPIIGFRVWLAGDAELGSYYQQTDWPVRERLKAGCYVSNAEAPCEEDHKRQHGGLLCGIYAYKTPKQAVDHDLDGTHRWSQLQAGKIIAVGTVKLWGKIHECEHGYRAEFAYPGGLFLVDRWRRYRSGVDERWFGLSSIPTLSGDYLIECLTRRNYVSYTRTIEYLCQLYGIPVLDMPDIGDQQAATPTARKIIP